jgi:hypothetical protein
MPKQTRQMARSAWNIDDCNLFLAMDQFGWSGREKEKIAPEQAATRLWTEFVMRAGIE